MIIPVAIFTELGRSDFDRSGIEFIDENGGGPGVRLRKRASKRGY
jgi:hypothetical protein